MIGRWFEQYSDTPSWLPHVPTPLVILSSVRMEWWTMKNCALCFPLFPDETQRRPGTRQPSCWKSVRHDDSAWKSWSFAIRLNLPQSRLSLLIFSVLLLILCSSTLEDKNFEVSLNLKVIFHIRKMTQNLNMDWGLHATFLPKSWVTVFFVFGFIIPFSI